jgi:hypothetical protein
MSYNQQDALSCHSDCSYSLMMTYKLTCKQQVKVQFHCLNSLEP